MTEKATDSDHATTANSRYASTASTRGISVPIGVPLSTSVHGFNQMNPAFHSRWDSESMRRTTHSTHSVPPLPVDTQVTGFRECTDFVPAPPYLNESTNSFNLTRAPTTRPMDISQLPAAYHQTTTPQPRPNGRILGEEVRETEIRVPRVVRREEIRERIVTIPERVFREEIIEETQRVRERIVQLEKPVWIDKYVELPEIEYKEKIVEVPEYRVEWKEIPVEKTVFEERVITKKVQVPVEKRVSVDNVQYREVPVVKQMEVPEVKVVFQDVPRAVDRHIEVPVPEVREIGRYNEICRRIPVAVEHIENREYLLPQLQPDYDEVRVPIYVPTFTEVPVPADLLTAEARLECQNLVRQIFHMARQQIPSLCLIEELGDHVRGFVPNFETNPDEIRRTMEEKIRQLAPQTSFS